jgi:ankyrin repeat protein
MRQCGGALACALALLLFSGCSNKDERLREAAAAGNTTDLRAALEEGANVEASGMTGTTALMLAVKNNQTEAVQVLLEKGANPNTALPDGRTALMIAAQAGHTAIVQALLKAGADVSVKNRDGATASVLATAGQH